MGVQSEGHDEYLRVVSHDRLERGGERGGVFAPPRASRHRKAERLALSSPAPRVIRVATVPRVLSVGIRVDARDEHVRIVPEDGGRAVSRVVIHVEHRDAGDVEGRSGQRAREHGGVVDVAVPAEGGRSGVMARVGHERVVVDVLDVLAGLQVALELGANAVDDGHVAEERGEERSEDGGVVVGVVVVGLRVKARAGAGDGVAAAARVARDEGGDTAGGARRPGRVGLRVVALEEVASLGGGHARPSIPRGGEVAHEPGGVRAERQVEGAVGHVLERQRHDATGLVHLEVHLHARLRRVHQHQLRVRDRGRVRGASTTVVDRPEAEPAKDGRLARVRRVVRVRGHERLRHGAIIAETRRVGEHPRLGRGDRHAAQSVPAPRAPQTRFPRRRAATMHAGGGAGYFV